MDRFNGILLDEHDSDPFALHDLWRPSVFTELDTPSSSRLFPIADEKSNQLVLRPSESLNLLLPKLDDFKYGLSGDRSSPRTDPEDFAVAAEDKSTEEEYCKGEDIWRESDVITSRAACRRYHCWEASLSEAFEYPGTPYITEAGAGAFDALLLSTKETSESGKIVEIEIFIKCLTYLGLGQNSLLFSFDEYAQSFYPKIPGAHPAGYSSTSFTSLIGELLRCGNQMRRLRGLAGTGFFRGLATGMALADAISIAVSTLQMQMSVDATNINTIVELHRFFQRPKLMLSCMDELVSAVSGLETDSAVLESLYIAIQKIESKHAWLRGTVIEIFTRVFQPWLEFVESWIGLHRSEGLVDFALEMENTFVKRGSDIRAAELAGSYKYTDYHLDRKLMPSFVHAEEAEIIFETGRGLRHLLNHHPDHPLAKVELSSTVEPPCLRWKISWDIESVEARAKEYEQNLMKEIRKYSAELAADDPNAGVNITASNGPHSVFEIFGRSQEDIQAQITVSNGLFERPLLSIQRGADGGLGEALLRDLESHTEAEDDSYPLHPPISAGPLLSFYPIILAQSRLINTCCLRMIFKEYDLKLHLSLQRRYQLFGDGLFSSRLTQALFDPNLESTERRRGVSFSGGLMGLQLGSRESWPPASSELRLALMGILSETYHVGDQATDSSGAGYLGRTNDLPGGLSFAVRAVPADGLEKIMNRDGVEALDFLRLYYQPPLALQPVIDDVSLDKYDCIFKLLLRVLRLVYSVNQHRREMIICASNRKFGALEQRFSIEAHHFVTNVFAYFLEIAIDSTWRRFEAKLEEIERVIDQEDSYITGGIHKLRQYHERTLNRIMFSLFLRKRQQEVMDLLTSIFSTILRFAALQNSVTPRNEGTPSRKKEVQALYLDFQKRASLFITVCRGLSERRGYGERKASLDNEDDLFGIEDKSEDGGNTIGHLVLRLDMNNYYSTRRH
ncbi:hypothetical protein L228DRAFT_260229 [Xylona heveae TC161]|uniref:Spindle pole body component n=1 Tax=Xylona heveae (strain CBS 132557 / TC161) TaxID=1328760 RepID=A0A165HEP0_XYLHT|nr:hypothetical protein L228DRAFT_260229 [Xylona heveae TC161]KZF23396.1 hypothetical protein L228DRAFT_260229 [Xylona heveae TC161]